MFTDAFCTLSSLQAITTTAVSTNTIDLSQNRDIGEGEDMYIDFAVGTTFTGGTSLQAQAITSAAASLTSPVVIGAGAIIPLATLVAGYRFSIRINNQLNSTGLRYLGANYVVVGTMTAGTITANVVTDVEDGATFYASGFAVL